MANLTGYLKDNQGVFIRKDPSANIVYALDWADYLKSGDTLSTTTVTISTITGDTTPLRFPTNSATDVSISGTKTQFRLSAGTAGNVYTIKVRITTTDGDTDLRQFRVVVNNKELE
jgi:hypothetical protein